MLVQTQSHNVAENLSRNRRFQDIGNEVFGIFPFIGFSFNPYRNPYNNTNTIKSQNNGNHRSQAVEKTLLQTYLFPSDPFAACIVGRFEQRCRTPQSRYPFLDRSALMFPFLEGRNHTKHIVHFLTISDTSSSVIPMFKNEEGSMTQLL